MKVAVFSRYPNDSEHPRGGVEAVTVVLVKALSRFGDMDVHVATLEWGRTKLVIEQDGDITIHRLPRSNWPEIMDVIAGPSKKRLVSYINKLQPDVFHAHETFGLCLGTISIPYVFTVHGFDHANLMADSARLARLRSPLWRLVERRGLSTQKHIISITPYVRQMIESQTHANIYDIDNPVDERYFKIERCPESGRVLCVGWINERKNTLGAVEAFAHVADQYPEARLVIAGEAKKDDYFNQIQQSIKKHAIANRIKMLGHINHEQLMEELAKASVFLLPSRQENAPMAIAEAMAAGIPVITSNRCGMPYMVQDGQTGYLVDPESNDQIMNCLIRLISSEQLCWKMGETARQVAVERFHPRAVALKTKAVYEEICANEH